MKSGHPHINDVRSLVAVLTREKASIGVLLTMEEPTGPMRKESASAGFYESPWGNKKHPKVQILTIEELLDGRGIDMPPIRHTSTTFKRAPRAKGKKARQDDLPFSGKAEGDAEDPAPGIDQST